MKNNENTAFTTGFINDSGYIEVPRFFFPDGAEVDLLIKVIPRKFEIAMFPSEMTVEDDELDRICGKFGDCDTCLVRMQCAEDLKSNRNCKK